MAPSKEQNVQFFVAQKIQWPFPPAQPRPWRVAIGVSAPVDPMSGMSVNLVIIQDWFKRLRSHLATLSPSLQPLLLSQEIYIFVQSCAAELSNVTATVEVFDLAAQAGFRHDASGLSEISVENRLIEGEWFSVESEPDRTVARSLVHNRGFATSNQ